MSDDAKMALAFVLSTAAMFPLAVSSGMYLQDVLGPLLRGTGFEFLALPCLAIIVFGSGWVWWKICAWLYDMMGGR